MSQNKKFIITKDDSVSKNLIAHGFCLLSSVCGTYVFINETKEHFTFDAIDVNKVHFTNTLTF